MDASRSVAFSWHDSCMELPGASQLYRFILDELDEVVANQYSQVGPPWIRSMERRRGTALYRSAGVVPAGKGEVEMDFTGGIPPRETETDPYWAAAPWGKLSGLGAGGTTFNKETVFTIPPTACSSTAQYQPLHGS